MVEFALAQREETLEYKRKMKQDHKNTIFSLLLVSTAMAHMLFLFIPLKSLDIFEQYLSKNDEIDSPLRVKIRTIGVEKSKKKVFESIPSKKSQGEDLFSKFQMGAIAPKPEKEVKQDIKNKNSSINRKAKEISKKRLNYQQMRIVQDIRQAKSNENPLLNHTDSQLEFIPPEGIKIEELNELEKVFYSFFRRTSIQYITGSDKAIREALQDKPHLLQTLKSHKPTRLRAKIRYDREGNAEVVKILESSYDDEVAKIFEKILESMVKIPNIASQLQDKNGRMTMHYYFNINTRSL
tara:strand:- start:4 stop:888 length:885 start_codon:yes stop_codon:yes gene_type:complete